MMGYPPLVFECALYELWGLVEDRLTDEERIALITPGDSDFEVAVPQHPNGKVRLDILVADAFEHLQEFGEGGPVGIGIGRFGGHVVGDET